MTENGELENVTLSDDQIEKIASIMEKRSAAEAQAEFADLLRPDQVEALIKAGIKSKEDIRAASDEELVNIKGIGAVSVASLREWSIGGVEKGAAISKRFLVLTNGAERLDVRPGDVIPAEFGAARAVEKGQAYWGE